MNVHNCLLDCREVGMLWSIVVILVRNYVLKLYLTILLSDNWVFQFVLKLFDETISG